MLRFMKLSILSILIYLSVAGFAESDEPELMLHDPKGDPPDLLRDAGTWKFQKEMSFAIGYFIRRYSFRDDHVLKQMEKVYFQDETRKPVDEPRVERHEPHRFPLKAWAKVLKIGEYYHSYQLDEERKALCLNVLVPVGKNQWYWAAGRWEVLLKFEADPFSTDQGKVAISRHNPRDEPARVDYVTEFTTEHYPSYPSKGDETWIVRINKHGSN